MITVEEAEKIILAHGRTGSAVSCLLTNAQGRVLREDIFADRDMPPFDRVTMDGVALSFASWQGGQKVFSIEAVQRAGEPALALRKTNSCIQVMTGAIVPKGCDCVVPVEDLEISGNQAMILNGVDVRKIQFIHRQGTDRRTGGLVLKAGTLIRAPQVAVLASVGKANVQVNPDPQIAVISNGDELVPVTDPVKPWQIRISNSHAVRAALALHGFKNVHLTHTRDDQAEIERALAEALQKNDMLILSGGVSMGQYDLIPAALKTTGVNLLFHKVSQKPGKPLAFGSGPGGKPVFALPGNPVSTLVCTYRYILPYLRKCTGALPAEAGKVGLPAGIDFEEPLTYFLPVRKSQAADGRPQAAPVRYSGSGDYAALADTDGFVELPQGRKFPAGSLVRFYSWSS